MPAAHTPRSLVEIFRSDTERNLRPAAKQTHYIPPERAGAALNLLSWRIGENAVLWPARPHPVIIRPGDDRAALRVIPLDHDPFDGNTSPRPTAIRKHLQAVAADAGPAGVPATRIHATFHVKFHLVAVAEALTGLVQLKPVNLLDRSQAGDYARIALPLQYHLAARFRNHLAYLRRLVPAAAHDDFTTILQLLRTLTRDVPLPVLHALLDRGRSGRRLREWYRRFPLAATTILDAPARIRLPVRAITRGEPDHVTLQTFAEQICRLQPTGAAARRHLRTVRLTAARSTTECQHLFAARDVWLPHRSPKYAAIEFCYAPVDPALPATTIAVDRDIMDLHQRLARTAAEPQRIHAFRKQLERDARRRLRAGTELPGFPHEYPRFIEQVYLQSQRSPPSPTPLRIAGIVCGRQKHLLSENDHAARVFEIAFGSKAPWQRLWLSSPTRQVRWNDWVRAVERWRAGAGWAASAALQANPADADIAWTSPAPPEPIQGVALHALTTPADLIAEGNALRHCVGGYTGECLAADPPIHLYSLRGPGSLRSTLAVQEDTIQRPGRHVLLCQHLGPGNRAPPYEHLRAADQFVQMLQNGNIPLDEPRHQAERKVMLAKRQQAGASADIALLRALLRRHYPHLRTG